MIGEKTYDKVIIVNFGIGMIEHKRETQENAKEPARFGGTHASHHFVCPLRLLFGRSEVVMQYIYREREREREEKKESGVV